MSQQALAENGVRTQMELEAALRTLGWELDGPKRTSGGWKAMIWRGTVSMLATGSSIEEVLEILLRDAAERAKRLQASP